jgi:hypothetical protein
MNIKCFQWLAIGARIALSITEMDFTQLILTLALVGLAYLLAGLWGRITEALAPDESILRGTRVAFARATV